MQRIATVRIVGLVVAIIGFGAAIWCAREAIRMNTEFRQWLVARPMETEIDLSEPGDTTVALHQTCSRSHGEALFLECDVDADAKRHPEKLLSGVSGTFIINDRDGEEIESARINNETVQEWNGKIMLAMFAPFDKGDYDALI